MRSVALAVSLAALVAGERADADAQRHWLAGMWLCETEPLSNLAINVLLLPNGTAKGLWGDRTGKRRGSSDGTWSWNGRRVKLQLTATWKGPTWLEPTVGKESMRSSDGRICFRVRPGDEDRRTEPPYAAPHER